MIAAGKVLFGLNLKNLINGGLNKISIKLIYTNDTNRYLFQYDDNIDRFQKKHHFQLMKKLILCGILILSACQAAPGTPENLTDNQKLEAKKVDLRRLAVSAKQRGDFNGASSLETQIMNLDTTDAQSFINLSTTLSKQGKKAEALDTAQTGERLMPQNEKLQLEVAMLMLQNNRVDDSLAKLNSFKGPKNTDYYNTLGVAYDMDGNHEVAQDTFDDGLTAFPDDELMKNNLGLSYTLSHNYVEAIKIFKDLSKNNPNKPKYRHNLAMAYALSGKKDEAMKILTKDMSKKQAEEDLETYKQMQQEME